MQKVTPDGPADQAGLEGGDATVSEGGQQVRAGGDVITAADGQAVSGMDDLISVINGKQPGDTVTLDILRDGDEQQVDVKLGNRPDDATGLRRAPPGSPRAKIERVANPQAHQRTPAELKEILAAERLELAVPPLPRRLRGAAAPRPRRGATQRRP